MRIPDPERGVDGRTPTTPGCWCPVPLDGAPAGTPRYRLLDEGTVVDHDGFTIPTPSPPEGLDLNRNFPAGWGTGVRGSGDHPLSEPEIDALVRAIVARPNVCGYNAFHTSGGVLLRPSSTAADSTLPPADVWVWKQLGEIGHRLTGYPVHSVFEDFTWDKSDTMSGAADDWAYEHLGVFSWTTEFWDVVHAATGAEAVDRLLVPRPDRRAGARRAALGRRARPRAVRRLVPVRAPAARPGRARRLAPPGIWTNPPPALLRDEVDAARRVRRRPGDGVAVPRDRPHRGRSTSAAARGGSRPASPTPAGCRRRSRPAAAKADADPARHRRGDGRGDRGRRRAGPGQARPARRAAPPCGSRHWHDGTPDRVLATWVVRAAAGTTVDVVARHERAGQSAVAIDAGVTRVIPDFPDRL